jgi:mannose-6-phosphate isomerase-like protein (cupin superfamily)
VSNPFPAATGVTHLAVYDWSGPDGRPGGSAHVHLACTEGYVVLGGSGRLQTLGPDGFAEVALTPLTVTWFGPGIIHRLINDGDLRILVVMQNSGLPEAGDAVLTFPPEYLTDPGTYQATAAPPDPERGEAAANEVARRRAELAIQGFLALQQRCAAEGTAALDEFYAAAAALVRPRVPAWRDVWERGALSAAHRTGEQLDALAEGRFAHLHDGRLTVLAPPDDRGYGMCGRLATYPGVG